MRLAWFVSSVVAVSVVLTACGSRGAGVGSAADWSDIQIPEGTLVVASPGQSLGEVDYKSRCRAVDWLEWGSWGADDEYQVGEDVYFEGTLTVAGEFVYASTWQPGWPKGLTAFSMGLGDARMGGIVYNSGVTVVWPGSLPASMPIMEPLDSNVKIHVKVWGVCQTLLPAPNNFPVVLGRYVTCCAE